MALSVLDGTGATKTLKSTTDGSDEVVHHLCEQSGSWSVSIAGLPGGLVGYSEDAAHSSGHVGVMALVVRSDAGGTLVSADGDYSALQVDSNGALRVTGGGGGTEYTEDAAAAANPVGNQLMLRRRDTLTASEVSADGDVIAANATAKGELCVKHADSIAVTGTFWQATQPVSLASAVDVTNAGTFAVQAAQSGTWTVDLGATDNAVLDAIAASLAGTLTVGGTITANLGTIAGVATEATLGGMDTKLSAIVTYLDTEIAAIVAAVELLDNAISGTEFQVDVVTAPARDRTTDSISAAIATDALMSGTTALTPKFANIDTASSGANTLVAAVTSKKIRVLGMQLVAAKGSSAVGALLRDDSGSPVNLYGGTGRIALDPTGATGPGGFTLPFSPVGWLETTAGQALILDLDAAQRVVGTVCYVEA